MCEIVRVEGAAAREEFLRLPWSLHAGQAAWVPPLLVDQRRALDPRRGEFFQAGHTGALFLARREGKAIGRIAALRNETHLRTHGDGVGFFGFFECVNEVDTARALLAAAEAWLRERGLKRSRGPANFSIQEEAGVALDGFDLQPMVGMTWTPAYYRPLLEQAGYRPCRDLRVYRLERPGEPRPQTERLERVATQVMRRDRVTVRLLDLNQLERESRHLATVFEESWRDNWGHVPISAEEFLALYRRYKVFLIPELIFLAEVDGEPAAAWVTMPDLNVAIKAIDGRIWPLGWWRLLRAKRTIARYRAMMLGVRPKFRRSGLPSIFAMRCRAELAKRKAELLEFSWILDDNVEVTTALERMGAQTVQTLRLYERELA